MDTLQLGLNPGQWIVADCGKTPSVKNCKLVLMAPVDQREDLLDASVAHAVKSHGHQETPELRDELSKTLEEVTL